ncbi:MAG: hypothetical protein QM774_03665 [Gordonia sp. (in: high G+C Gram-positive bacteria)]|uniref:hypothetical protein n=1 Tax=Gordonia sp. (in: high G+C Gram-positive bacteria) TaxID=84139 RepID=UPI0039E6B618
MSSAVLAGSALVFLWLGMVLAISFIEAPLKFRAPHITIPLGLGIGRLVFRALNSVESAIAVALIVIAAVSGAWPTGAIVGLSIAVLALVVQIVGVRPVLSRRTDAVLADPENVPSERSHAHLAYVGCELVKVAALIATGVYLLLS